MPPAYARDLELLIRDKYDGDASRVTDDDRQRLQSGEPLAYVIGSIPFLGLTIDLASRPLIPRPETEYWTEQLCARLRARFAERPFAFLDLCAGSGCIGLAVLQAFPAARVTFAELRPAHARLIAENLARNGLDPARARIIVSDLFDALPDARFDCIAANPPYIPDARDLAPSVRDFEPPEALYAGADGLDVIRRIAASLPERLMPAGELWMECDIANAAAAAALLRARAARAETRADQYGRPRLVLAWY